MSEKRKYRNVGVTTLFFDGAVVKPGATFTADPSLISIRHWVVGGHIQVVPKAASKPKTKRAATQTGDDE